MLVLAGAYPNHASLTISNNVLNGSSFTPMLVCLCGRLNYILYVTTLQRKDLNSELPDLQRRTDCTCPHGSFCIRFSVMDNASPPSCKD